MNSGIYKIANKVTDNFYVGSAVNLSKRISNHKSDLQRGTHKNPILQNVFNKYGIDKLSFEVIEIVKDKNKLIEREQHYIDTLIPKYNIRKIANSNLGLKWSKETKLKMSKSQKGNKYCLGHKATEETKLKMAKASKGNKYALGYKHTEKTKLKMSESHIGKSLSEQHKLKLSEAHKDKKLSEQHKLKISEFFSKPFKIKSPQGTVIEEINLRKFCRDNNLSRRSIWRVINNKQKSYKGWTKGE